MTAAAAVIVALLVAWINHSVRLDAHYKRVDQMLSDFRTGDLAACRAKCGNYLHRDKSKDGTDAAIEYPRDEMFRVVWYFASLHALRISLLAWPKWVLNPVREYLDNATRIDVELWADYCETVLEENYRAEMVRSVQPLLDLRDAQRQV